MTHFDPSEANDIDVMAFLKANFPSHLPERFLTSSPVAPMHLATGAGWGHNAVANKVLLAHQAPKEAERKTPHAVIRSAREHERQRELKHWATTGGKQVVSNRATEPAVSFHNGPSGRVVEERGRCREIGEHPCVRNPGPENYTIEADKVTCMVPSGWNHEKRFKHSAFSGEQGYIGLIKHSTDAHPYSPAYPYEVIPPRSKTSETPAAQPKMRSSVSAQTTSSGTELLAPEQGSPQDDNSVANASYLHPLKDPSDEANRRNPIRTADLNCQYFKYQTKPTWGFGSSGLGYRFKQGTAFSRQAPVRTSSRLRGFRDLRDEIPEISEKEWQVALDKALADAVGGVGVPAEQTKKETADVGQEANPPQSS
jgi:hypothetical protein